MIEMHADHSKVSKFEELKIQNMSQTLNQIF